jgi:hypothetical protein
MTANRRRIAYTLFWAGVFLFLVHTTLPVLWRLFGLPEPFPLAPTTGALAVLPGLTPPLGAALMLIAGRVYAAAAPEHRP